MRRTRVHQAWYRSEVLGITGYGVLAGSGAPCGSVLPVGAVQRNLNFTDPEALNRYLDRRTRGWGVDPIRCTSYMTSSQTLSFNMFAGALTERRASARLFNQLLRRSDLFEVVSSDFEFAAQGTPFGLGDKTLVDVMLRFRTRTGHIQVVAVETKLADRFSTRRTRATGEHAYQRLARQSSLWPDFAAAVADNRTRQLTRCHALAQSVQFGSVIVPLTMR